MNSCLRACFLALVYAKMPLPHTSEARGEHRVGTKFCAPLLQLLGCHMQLQVKYPPVTSTGEISFPGLPTSIAHLSGDGLHMSDFQEREVAQSTLSILYEASTIASPQQSDWV